MPKETALQRRRRLAILKGVTSSATDFAHMCRRKPDRVGVIAEGDSWFAYPRKWIAFGADINVVHHVADKLEGTDTANLLRLASNGDEAVNMTSGKQFKKLYKILKRNSEAVDILLFSGGGNDIVGKDDLLPLLNEYSAGMTHLECIHQERFARKLDSIVLAYQRLIDLVIDVAPHVTVVTHIYDIAKPWDQGADFFWGLIKTDPWVFPYMERRHIPRKLHLPVMEHMLVSFGQRITELSDAPASEGRLRVVNTQGTLKPGSKVDWLNEIHPSESGFKKITKLIYADLKAIEPSLPTW